MNMITLLISIVSIILAYLSLVNSKTAQSRSHDLSSLTYEALGKVRQSIDRLDVLIANKKSNTHGNPDIRRIILELRSDLERRVRRIALYTNDEQLVINSLLWFMNHAIIEDRTYIYRALKFGYITGQNKNTAITIIQKLDSDGGY